ncbi:MAG: terpene cyclase/mutase family protein [Methanomicrobia archaeon]|nr:terpene cyclase/mutase family protein [Methanomicrobia archaeon]
MGIEKTLDCIKKNGTDLERYRIEYLFYNKKDDKIPLKIFSKMQNENGGFPYDLEKWKDTRICETCSVLSILSELNLLDYDIAKKSIKYLLKKQKGDGRWSENLEILKYDPPLWNMPEDLKCDMWLTAEIALKLLKLGYRDSAEKAANFLARNKKDDKFFGFLLTNVIATSLFSCLEKKDEIKNMDEIIRDIIEKEEEPAFLNWYLETLKDSKLEYKDSLMKICLEKIRKKITKNIIFESVDGKRYNIPNTIDSLKLLKKYGKI